MTQQQKPGGNAGTQHHYQDHVSNSMRQTIRTLCSSRQAAFVAASLIHSGALIIGYEHHQARIAEGVIATVLLAAVASTWIRPVWTCQAELAAQAFALLGTLIGVFTIVIGIGPRTIPDIAYHVAIVAVLVWSLVIVQSAPMDEATAGMSYAGGLL